MRNFLQKFKLIKNLKPSWVLFRFFYLIKLKSGWFRLTLPRRDWNFYVSKRFMANPPDWKAFERNCRRLERIKQADLTIGEHERNSIFRRAESVLNGNFELFSDAPKKLSIPPDWLSDPYGEAVCNSNSHWSNVKCEGDIKNIWELSRFSWIFILIKAQVLAEISGNEISTKFRDAIIKLLSDWMEKNPPNNGVNWSCGQETSMRLCSLIFALSLSDETFLSKNENLILPFIGACADRIKKNLSYALSQKNNHGITESVGLYLAGIFFPNFKDSAVWKKIGLKYLRKQCEELFFTDGSFSQNSTNYHRLALDGLLLSVFAARLNDETPSREILSAMERSFEFLSKICNPETGAPPRYGSDDGSHFLQLSDSDYFDFRPLLGALAVATGKRVPEDDPAYLEKAAWLFGEYPKRFNGRFISDLKADQTGYYALKHGRAFAFLRCGKSPFRMGHCDMLSLWLEIDCRPIAVDPGSYSYLPKRNALFNLESSTGHNVLSICGCDYAVPITRFLRLPFPECSVLSISTLSGAKIFFGESRPYLYMDNPPVYRRILILLENGAIVVDSAHSCGEFKFASNWLLNGTRCVGTKEGQYLFNGDTRIAVSCTAPSESRLAIGSPDAVISPRYNKITDAAKITTETVNAQEAFFCTAIIKANVDILKSQTGFKVKTGNIEVQIDTSKILRANSAEEVLKISLSDKPD